PAEPPGRQPRPAAHVYTLVQRGRELERLDGDAAAGPVLPADGRQLGPVQDRGRGWRVDGDVEEPRLRRLVRGEPDRPGAPGGAARRLPQLQRLAGGTEPGFA